MAWAVRERVLGSVVDGEWVETIKPTTFATADMRKIRDQVVRRLPKRMIPLPREKLVAEMSGARKVRYQRAAESLVTKPLSKEDAHINAFIKAEKWAEVKAPRVISPRDPRYLLEVGRYLLPVEKQVYRAFEKVAKYPIIMKGYTPVRRAGVLRTHWESFNDPVGIGLDASKFDQHVSVKALEFEHAFYRAMYPGDTCLPELLGWQLHNTVYFNGSDGKCKWTTEGGRMSGDINTALGNCILSATMLLAYAKELGILIKCVVDGDDCVAIMERRDAERFRSRIKEWYLARGFRMKVEDTVDEFEKIEFCQSQPVCVAGEWLMVRNPRKALRNDCAWVEDGSISHQEVVAATGVGGLSLYAGVPVLQSLYTMMTRASPITKRAKKVIGDQGSWLRWAGEVGRTRPITDGTRISFWVAFGIDPAVQIALESELASVPIAARLQEKITEITYKQPDLLDYWRSLI